MENQLSTVHEAMSMAAQTIKTEGPMVAASYRIEPELKKKAEVICEANGTSLSEFLRNCCKCLIYDYIAPKE